MEQATLLPIIIDAFAATLLCILTILISFSCLKWVIERTTDAKLMALPASIFQIIFTRLTPQTETLLNNIISKYISIPRLFEALEPEKVTNQSIIALRDYTIDFTDELMRDQNPVLWDNLPNFIRHRTYRKIEKLLDPVANAFIDYLGGSFEEIFDYSSMIKKQIKKDARLVNQITLETLFFYWQSLKERSILIATLLGLSYAFFAIIGLAPDLSTSSPMLVAFILLTVASSILISYLSCQIGVKQQMNTNSLETITPKSTSKLWLHQQQHFNLVLAQLLAHKIFFFPDIMEHIFTSRKNLVKIRRMMRKSLQPITDGTLLKLMTQIFMGPSALVSIKNKAIDQALKISNIPLNNSTFIQEQTNNLERSFKHQLEQIPNLNFYSLLQPLLSEIRLWLIGIATATGIFIGLIYTLLLN